MKKKLLSAVSFILVLTMIMAFPLEVFAKGKEPGKKPKVGPEPEVRSGEFDELAETAKTFEGEESGISVTVEAPEGALPDGTEMVLTALTEEEIVEVEKAADGHVLAALDISFTFDEEEILPQVPVKVYMMSDSIESASDDAVIIHIDGETGDPEPIEPIDEESPVNAVIFESMDFSVYAVIEPNKAFEDEPVIVYGEEAVPIKLAAASTRAAGPANSKNLISNGDGTYTLALSVTGAQSSSSTSEISKANIVLVLDTSSSMNNSAGNTYYMVIGDTPAAPTEANYGRVTPTFYRQTSQGQYQRLYYRRNAWRIENRDNATVHTGVFYTNNRMWAEIHALTDDGGIIDSLLAQNVPGDANKKDIIEIALVNFNTAGHQIQDFTTVASTLKEKIQGLNTGSGTNWEDALAKANAYATSIKNSQPTENVYVVFLTDGQPTDPTGAVDSSWTSATDDARAIVNPTGAELYGLFTWGDSGNAHYLSSLIQYAYTGTGNSSSQLSTDYAKYYQSADSTEELIDALSQIVHDITVGVGYTNVEMEDGVTDMTTSSIKTSTTGTITGLKYYRSGGSYGTADPDNGNFGTEWTDAPAATINSDGEIDWNLGNLILENGVTYTITFSVWPSQESIDLVADLNNGIISYSSLSDDLKEQIHVSGTHYTLKTNTDYPTVTYSTITTTTVDGETQTEVSEPTTSRITNPDPVGLAESKLNAKKQWEDSLDPSQREEIDDVELYLLVDGKYYFIDSEGKPLGVTLTEESSWTYTNYVNIAPGIMVTEGSPAYDPDAVHVTWEGTTYAILETGHEYVFEESDINNHYVLTAYKHHPMIMGTDSSGNPVIKDVVFTKDASENITGIASVSNMGDNLSATNTLKGGINVSKAVVDAQGNKVDSNDTFQVTVHLTDADGNALPTKKAKVGTDTVDYTIDYRIYYGEKNPLYAESGEKHRSDHIYVTGTSFTEELYVGDVIRVVNVEDEALFYIDETLPSGYVSNSFDYKIHYGTEADAAYSEDDIVVKDNVSWYKVKGNSASTATVTNKLPDAFYVYHSSDNTVERIAMNDKRVSGGKFNIVNETKSGYLYGGYYKVYSLTTATDAEIIAMGYSTKSGTTAYEYATAGTGGLWADDSKGTAYAGDLETWVKTNAYTENGAAMTPKANTVYYLKEVPDVYLQPATYVVYDEIDVVDGNYAVKKLYQMTATDDGNYTSVGFDVKTYKGISDTGAFAADYYWGEQIDVTKNGEVYAELTAGNIVTDHAGLIAARDITDKYIVENAYYMLTPYHITPDNIKVNAVKRMTVYIRNTRFNTNWRSPAMTKSILSKKAAYISVE